MTIIYIHIRPFPPLHVENKRLFWGRQQFTLQGGTHTGRYLEKKNHHQRIEKKKEKKERKKETSKTGFCSLAYQAIITVRNKIVINKINE